MERATLSSSLPDEARPKRRTVDGSRRGAPRRPVEQGRKNSLERTRASGEGARLRHRGQNYSELIYH
eukprot:scaffold140867_cov31-Tisochrysis_lutea.AAC.1